MHVWPAVLMTSCTSDLCSWKLGCRSRMCFAQQSVAPGLHFTPDASFLLFLHCISSLFFHRPCSEKQNNGSNVSGARSKCRWCQQLQPLNKDFRISHSASKCAASLGLFLLVGCYIGQTNHICWNIAPKSKLVDWLHWMCSTLIVSRMVMWKDVPNFVTEIMIACQWPQTQWIIPRREFCFFIPTVMWEIISVGSKNQNIKHNNSVRS